jgi:parvulin-like peptidyl-prolyl isomerase
VLRDKAGKAAADKAASVAAALKSAADFAAAAKKAGFEAKTSELVARGAALPDVGSSPAVEKAAFGMAVASVSDPITTPDGATIVKLLERQDVKPEERAASRDSVRQDLLNERRGEFFTAYMGKARQRMKIDVNREVLANLLG